MTKNAYIHIPFCKSKCHYCSFVSFDNADKKEEYINALISQIKYEYKNELLDTIYFGGGTPSLLNINDVKRILSLFNFNQDTEITFEVNPDSIDFRYLKILRTLGINRLSIGSQTFDDKILKIIGRRHSADQIRKALLKAKAVGFDNISLDFIYGLPTQSLEDFSSDLNEALKLNVQHISLYGLKIEDGCNFYNSTPNSLPDSDMQADMYLKAIEILTSNGFEQYEISNFSLPGFNSKHNLNYWDNSTYYGFGCSASGYINQTRYQNNTNLEDYIQSPLSKDFEQELTKEEILEEEIFLGLRKTAGIDIIKINKKFNIDFESKYKNIIVKYKDLLVKTKLGYAFTTQGSLLSNNILSEFID